MLAHVHSARFPPGKAGKDVLAGADFLVGAVEIEKPNRPPCIRRRS